MAAHEPLPAAESFDGLNPAQVDPEAVEASQPLTGRRTKRRYAHELYPHAVDEYEARPLTVEVPYLYARAIGFDLWGTGWASVEPRSIGGSRVAYMIACRQLAFLADALHQGFAGNEAWARADECVSDETGEWLTERAEFYGVPYNEIKPYPCGPERDHHDHFDAPDAHGWRTVHRAPGIEAACMECTEPVETEKESN